ncbi:hypothetical protein RJ639_037537 [Escallonia herrerae]|uniref:Uncharacterized protein n=1 Tax=Escallonia herrerae TaxID=1293975 RepID=A0AA88WKN1_9ASTE|nr:hypothetical protein RJ639_037537 [Escallonia herrerae]
MSFGVISLLIPYENAFSKKVTVVLSRFTREEQKKAYDDGATGDRMVLGDGKQRCLANLAGQLFVLDQIAGNLSDLELFYPAQL